MRLGRKPQLWVPHKCPFPVLLDDPPSPLATRPNSTSPPAAMGQRVPPAAVVPSLGSKSGRETGTHQTPPSKMSLAAKAEEALGCKDTCLHFLRDQTFYSSLYDTLLRDCTFCYGCLVLAFNCSNSAHKLSVFLFPVKTYSLLNHHVPLSLFPGLSSLSLSSNSSLFPFFFLWHKSTTNTLFFLSFLDTHSVFLKLISGE